MGKRRMEWGFSDTPGIEPTEWLEGLWDRGVLVSQSCLMVHLASAVSFFHRSYCGLEDESAGLMVLVRCCFADWPRFTRIKGHTIRVVWSSALYLFVLRTEIISYCRVLR